MRALFEDWAFEDVFSGIKLTQVNLPQNANRRDLWFRVFQKSDNVHFEVRAYPTRALAYVDPVSDDFVASKTFNVSALPQSITLTTASLTPDMTGLSIAGLFTSLPDRDDTLDLGVVYGYDSSPDAVTSDNMRTRILEHSGVGQTFEGIKARNISVYDSARIQDLVPCGINIVPGNPQTLQSDGPQKFAFRYPFVLQVATSRLVRNESNALACRRYAENLRAMFCGDHRLSYGEVHVITFVSISDPEPISGQEDTIVCNLELAVDYRNLWRDDMSPRG